jgi:hypothetical protein
VGEPGPGFLEVGGEVAGEPGGPAARGVCGDPEQVHAPDDRCDELARHLTDAAAQRNFSPTWSNAQIIRFVAHVRELLSDRAELLDPLAGELELRRVLGEPIPASPNIGARAAAQLILLDAMIQSLSLDDAAIWDLSARHAKM